MLLLSGCIDDTPKYVPYAPNPIIESNNLVDYTISGSHTNYNLYDAKTVTISGECNNIRILNTDLEKITISGSTNNIAYSKSAHATIIVTDTAFNNNLGQYDNPLLVRQSIK